MSGREKERNPHRQSTRPGLQLVTWKGPHTCGESKDSLLFRKTKELFLQALVLRAPENLLYTPELVFCLVPTSLPGPAAPRDLVKCSCHGDAFTVTDSQGKSVCARAFAQLARCPEGPSLLPAVLASRVAVRLQDVSAQGQLCPRQEAECAADSLGGDRSSH